MLFAIVVYESFGKNSLFSDSGGDMFTEVWSFERRVQHSPLIRSVAFPWFQLPTINCGENVRENSRSKQCISFKPRTVLSSMMESHTVPLHPLGGVNHPSVCAVCTPPT